MSVYLILLTLHICASLSIVTGRPFESLFGEHNGTHSLYKNVDANKITPSIVGGEPVPRGQGMYRFFAWGAKCGATLIHNDTLLTSARCQLSFLDTGRVVIGSTRRNAADMEPDTEFRAVLQTIQHPKYNKITFEFDLMLVRLTAPVNTFTPIQLNGDASVPADDELVRLIGLGDDNDGFLSNQVMMLDLEITPHETCQNEWRPDNIEESIMLCAADANFRLNKAMCLGDRGGPLLRKVGSEYVQVGVASFSSVPCGTIAGSDVYARVSEAFSWIREQTCSLSSIKTGLCSSMNAPTAPPTPAPTRVPISVRTKVPTRAPSKVPTPMTMGKMMGTNNGKKGMMRG